MEEGYKKIGSYKTLLAYQKSECAFDITHYFVGKFLQRKNDRTADQMQQAARSGKQNIVEGYSDAESSTEIEHELTVIAKGSLEELKEDFQDYLRNNGLEIWDNRHWKYQACQPRFRRHNDSAYYRRQIEGRSAEDVANIALIVIHQTLALIRGLIDRQDRLFLQNGGIKEQRYRARLEYRNGRDGRFSRESREGRNIPTAPTKPTTPTEPTNPQKQ